jgi:hypothetical protein
LIFLGISISLLTSTINGLMADNTGAYQAAGAGAVILIVMQVKNKKKKVYLTIVQLLNV